MSKIVGSGEKKPGGGKQPAARIAMEAGAQRKSYGDRSSTGGQKQVGKREVSEK